MLKTDDGRKPENNDEVNHPNHYTTGDIECIDAIRSMLGDGFKDYCRGNVIKYGWRAPHKGSEVKDYLKARQYLDWLIDEADLDARAKREAREEGEQELQRMQAEAKAELFAAESMTVSDVFSTCNEMTGSTLPVSDISADQSTRRRFRSVYGVENKGCMKTVDGDA